MEIVLAEGQYGLRRLRFPHKAARDGVLVIYSKRRMIILKRRPKRERELWEKSYHTVAAQPLAT